MILDIKIKSWHNSTITFQVEDRFIDTGEIMMFLEENNDFYAESLTLDDLINLKNKIEIVIQTCKQLKTR